MYRNPKSEIRNSKQIQNPKSETQNQAKTENPKPYNLGKRTLEFAKRAISYVNKLPKTMPNVEVGKQLVRSAGSIGANYIEAEYTPEYGTNRLRRAVEVMKRYGTVSSSVLNIGCGTASDLDFVKKETGVDKILGVDISAESLSMAHKKTGCDTLRADILDNGIADKIHERYDFALLFSVLHHLIGKTRGDSMRLAIRAVTNSMRLLKDGGYLIIEEPTYNSPSFSTSLFYLKKIVTRMTSKRVTIGKKWNIGAPETSYYTSGQLMKMAESIGSSEVVDRFRFPEKRFLRIMTRSNVNITLRKAAASKLR